MEKKIKIVGGPSLDAMFDSFRTRNTKGIRFTVEPTDEEVEPSWFHISSIEYKDGIGTVFGLEGYFKGEGRPSRDFRATYCAKEGSGTIELL